jgi:hypothetical protein
MIVSVGIDYPVSHENLFVTVQFPNNTLIINLAQHVKIINLEFELPVRNHTFDIKFCCNDICIVDNPMTITDIVLDNFYQFDKLLYRGCPKFDQQFLSLAAQKNMYIDTTVNDSNRLDFTGQLVYNFVWPFYKNIFE